MYMQFSYKLKCKIRRLESEKQIKKNKKVLMWHLYASMVHEQAPLCLIFSPSFFKDFIEKIRSCLVLSPKSNFGTRGLKILITLYYA